MMRFILGVVLALGLSSAALAQADIAARNWRTSQVSVATSATLVAAITPTRRKVMVTTTGTNQVTCGPANTVTAGNGQPIAPTANSSITIETSAEVWCIAASTQAVAVMENY